MSNTETFTASGNPEQEERVRADLEFIADSIMEKYPSTLTVAVVGAFGRGEGAVIHSGDTYIPWNDYDIFVVTDDRTGWEWLGKFGHGLAEIRGIPSIDILPMLPEEIVKKAGTMPVYDACHGHRILRGDGSFLSPSISVGIESREIFTLCVNRMICLLEAPPATLTGIPPDPQKYASQVSKTIFAVMDAALHASGSYVTSYREKTRKFLALDTVPSVLKTAAEDALSFRLAPRPMEWDETRWFLARDHLLRHLVGFESKSAGDIRVLAGYHWRRRFGSLRAVLRNLASGSIPDCSCRAVECAEMLLLAAAKLDSDTDDSSLLSNSAEYLRRAGTGFEEGDWKATAEAVVAAWFRFCHA